MCISDSHDKTPTHAFRCPAFFVGTRARRSLGLIVCAALSASFILSEKTTAQSSDWELTSVDAHIDSPASKWTPSIFDTDQPSRCESTVRILRKSEVSYKRMADTTVEPAEFEQVASEEPPQLPSYLNPGEDMPQPPLLDTQSPDQSVVAQLDQLARRMDELEKRRIAQEDATRTIIRKSFAERASNITDTVTFGGTLETLTFWQSNFDKTTESDIRMDTAELDFDIAMNTWSHASLYIEYDQGNDFLFPTSEGDVVGVDRFVVRRGIITIGNTEKYPVYITTGRDFVPFGISTGDPVLDVLTITDPLTVEVFQTQEDFVMFGF